MRLTTVLLPLVLLSSAPAVTVLAASLPYTEPETLTTLSASTINYFDTLIDELGPGSTIDSALPKYANLMKAIKFGTYLSPSERSRAQSAAPISPLADEPRHSVTQHNRYCETSDGSPYLANVADLMHRAKTTWADKKCDQSNKFKSRCSLLGRHGEAEFSICGDVSSWTVKCDKLLRMWTDLIKRCPKRHGVTGFDVVGGYWTFTYRYGPHPDATLDLRVLIH
ncbi:hypothetical protein BJ508DRAFT_366360 [Ascobolus immersus RN42]|uniref:Uncharacterized protein n=1 Tax=Ascobolus immersus RN42 TaxID=1160509 RepID=A0A3N4HLR1_ASCIM|nr:hypothetical protein BJ508DRAFT_366360 [Ascobolus immersus RN42]